MKHQHSHNFSLISTESCRHAGRYQWVFIQVSHYKCPCGKKMKVVDKHSCQDKELVQAPEWVQEIIVQKSGLPAKNIA